MANSIISPDIIAKEALMQLQNNLGMAKYVHREYKNEFKKIGNTVDVRKPVKFQAIDGATRVNQDVEESTTAVVTIDQRKHVSWNFSTQDLTLTIDEYSERYIKPAAIALANTVDRSLHGLYTQVWNHVGTPGTAPDDYEAVSKVAQRMDEMAVPNDGRRYLCVNPAAGHAIANTATTLYIGGVNKEAYRNGSIGELAGINTMRAQNVQNHTVGAHAGTPLVNGASQGTTYALSKATYTQTLNTDGWANSVTGVLKAGDVITIAGVKAVNPVPAEGASASAATKTVMPYLQEFVVTADADSGASTGPAALTISPPIITSGPFQTVDAEPADNAAITVKTGTASTAYAQNIGFHQNAFALVTVPLEQPDGAAFTARETDSENGMSLRVVKDYDIENDLDIIRLDILYGIKAIYPELACRLTS